jgi:hypothetical protein
MRRTTDILHGVLSQTLTLLVKQGRPTSATFEVFRNYSDDDATAEFSGTATVDTVNTTVSAASGTSEVDPLKISLTSTTGIEAGRRYLLAENELEEWVDPLEVTATYVRVRHPLENDYTTSATFKSTNVSAAVDSTFVADLNKLSDTSDTAPDYRVVWTVVVGGATIIAYSFFDVVRAHVRHQVEISDVTDRAPGLHDNIPTEYRTEQGRPLLEAAWRALRADLVKIGVDVNTLREDEVLDELVILRSLRVLAEGGWRPGDVDWAAYLTVVTGNYDRFFEQHFAVQMRHQQQFQAGGLLGAAPTAEPFCRK